ncbi:MAG: aromatic hydrocarbon degradation protein [Chitinophagaceae bacterium]
MNRKIYILACLFLAQQVVAQTPEDALRMTWTTPSGSARHQAIGGAMGSLGGEITATFVNPAGLGFYKTGEIVLSPGFSFLKTKGSFRGSDAMSLNETNKFTLGTSGLVWGWSNKYSKWKSTAFSIGVNRMANFNQDVYYSGNNDYSSFTENAANEFFDFYSARKNSNPNQTDAAIIDQALGDFNISIPTKLALYTYLVDIDSTGGQKNVISRSEIVGLVGQENTIRTRGGITEIALGLAANMDDKLYIGGSFGIPIVNYSRTSTFKESDATGNATNKFNYFSYSEDFSSKGFGINAKLGVIIKPQEYLRLGLAIHSPTLYTLNEKFSSRMVADLENRFDPKIVDDVSSTIFTDNTPAEYKYDLVTPLKVLVSGSYVLREIEDVRKQRGFLTADIEYVNYKWSSFSAGDETSDDSYYEGVNNDIDDAYKGAFNFRAGGELKFHTVMTRLGFAYYGSPYQDKELKARRMYISGGLGYRNKGVFIDLTYVHQLNKDVNFPYRLAAPRQNTFATLKESGSNVMLTVGFKI